MSPSSISSSTSSSSILSHSNFTHLPIFHLRDMIVSKILHNRVTLIVGETGCGKSSQIPQFLLEANMEPILCTQPRRFAVVAVARMVAKARNCELGGEVGYHIGHSRVMSSRSRIIFKTAGVLLDEMRESGLNALKYKVIILDEVHERSVESDLVLVCIKEFLLKNSTLRVVLMSATADLGRYKDYFRDLGRGERVEVVAILSSNQKTIFQRKVSYLDQVTDLLGISSESLSETYCSGPIPKMSAADIKPEVQKLIHDLILHIHDKEPDIEKSILIFLPTYNSLEEQWHLLRNYSSLFKIHILHSSIETQQALLAMEILKSHRKVILATNIAESSVTIPKVAYIIDSCRSLQIFWDSNRKRDCAELVWVSKSQAEQRRGRTGRTCDGKVYRLVTKSFFSQMSDYECPSIKKLSLRLQVLLLCCAQSKAISNPRVLMQKSLDPPEPEVVEDALNLLLRVHALESTPIRGRCTPTYYGRLIASFSLSFEASVLIIKFGEVGLLREGILFGILMDTQPLPILRPFGEEVLFTEYTDCYFNRDTSNNFGGKKELLLMSNFSAFCFWQRVFKDKHRIEHLKQILDSSEVNISNSLITKIEEEWCSFHNLVQSSLQNVSEIYEDILSSLHRFRPEFMESDALPLYYDPYEYKHLCVLKHNTVDIDDVITDSHAKIQPDNVMMSCISMPFVFPGQFQSNNLAENLVTIIKEIRAQHSKENFADLSNGFCSYDFQPTMLPALCTFFSGGLCNRGSQCLYSHSKQAMRPICKYFFTFEGCRYGESCFFSHSLGPEAGDFNEPMSSCLPEKDEADAQHLLQLLPFPSMAAAEGYTLILDDNDFHFSTKLSRYLGPSKLIATTSMPESSVCDPSLSSVSIMWGLHHPYDTIISGGSGGGRPIPWKGVKCVLWFPEMDGSKEALEEHKYMFQTFFEYLAIRMVAEAMYETQVIITMNNLVFALLQVEKAGRECFYFLTESFPFDEVSFGELRVGVKSKRTMVASRAVSYVFDLHLPTDIQFGDYTSLLTTSLLRHSNKLSVAEKTEESALNIPQPLQ